MHNWVDADYIKKKIFLSYEKDCVFKVKLFKKNSYQNQIIHGFDYVTLEHTEMQALLTADVKYECGNIQKPFVYLRKYTGDIPEEKFNINSVWIIEPQENNFLADRLEVTNL